jgi:hypothetical protein
MGLAHLDIPLPLLVLPCVVLDRLRELEHADATAGLLPPSGFDDWEARSDQ